MEIIGEFINVHNILIYVLHCMLLIHKCHYLSIHKNTQHVCRHLQV